jgi:hypothetical protein
MLKATLLSLTLLLVMTTNVAQAHSTRITATTPGLQIVQLRHQLSHDINAMQQKYVEVKGTTLGNWVQVVQKVISKQDIAFHKRHYLWVSKQLQRRWKLLGNVSAWTCIHRHEGSWTDSGSPYWGGLQMDIGFQTTYGSDMIAKYHGYANVWHPYDQMIVAQRAYRSGRGYYPWPNTARACGLI